MSADILADIDDHISFVCLRNVIQEGYKAPSLSCCVQQAPLSPGRGGVAVVTCTPSSYHRAWGMHSFDNLNKMDDVFSASELEDL